ncbi:receptor-like kinase LIP1 [Chenopodium quinoa]|uniref:receptor-like kinase LIP1 n=1 Tax=Chenopodium quinoa TaxID=63459 RepID=UPI000B79A93F|nr:receptor-like kinase LIP1 [Chenopodium quinoa]
MCLQEESSVRPLIGDVVAALSFLAVPQPSTAPASATPANAPPSEQKMLYEIETKKNKPSQSDDSLRYDDSESTQSGSDQRNGGSYQKVELGEKDCSSLYSGRGQSFDTLEEHIIYTSDSDSGGGNTNYDDAETTELEDPERSIDSIANYSLHSARSTDSSMQSDAGYRSSKHGSSRRSSPTYAKGSRRRKPVVTFKEPSLSAKKNGTRKPEGENSHSDSNNQTVLSAATDVRQQQQQQQQQQQKQQQHIQEPSSSSSSSGSSSESEEENGSPKHMKDTHIPLQNNGFQEQATSSPDRFDNHRVFEQPHKESPQLRHLKTR